MLRSLLALALPLAVALFPASRPANAVDIDWVTVGDPGNACDPQVQGCFGAVPRVYRVSRNETTNAQYAEFLNAVARTDPNGLYNTRMGSGDYPDHGGIERSGSDGSYLYSLIARRENLPVNYVSFYDSLRFANWLHNGQPSGAQDSTTTEDGAYTFTGVSSVGARNPEAQIFLTSEDEWYKAAYYDAQSAIYFDYPAGTDAQTTCALPLAWANTANCNDYLPDLTPVGSYTGSASPSGTFDQGGNAWEWNEAIIGPERGMRGGSYLIGSPVNLSGAARFDIEPTREATAISFRLASVPEPGTGLLVTMGLLALAFRPRRSRRTT